MPFIHPDFAAGRQHRGGLIIMWPGNHNLGTGSHPTQTIIFGNGIILLGATGAIIHWWLCRLQQRGAEREQEKPDEMAKTLPRSQGAESLGTEGR